MGQKVNPHGLRVGVIKDWDSKWYAEKDFADNLVEDHEIRKFLKKRLYSAGISKIEIERASDRVKIIVYTAKPGVVIGKGGSEIENKLYDSPNNHNKPPASQNQSVLHYLTAPEHLEFHTYHLPNPFLGLWGEAQYLQFHLDACLI